MGFWITALFWVGSLVIGRILQPRAPRFASIDAKPEKFEGITAEEGRPVPVLWGTRQFKGSNLGWYGDLSNTAIVQNSATVGYLYYMGAQFLICTGPIDELVAVNWNDKPVGASITGANNSLVIGIAPPPYYTASIAPGNYASGAALSLAVETAIKAAQAGNWKVTFGFTIEAGRNDRIYWRVRETAISRDMQATIPAGVYASGTALAAAIQSLMDAAEQAYADANSVAAGSFIVSYSPGGATNKFKFVFFSGFGFGTNDDWTLYGADYASFSYGNTAKSTLGFRMDQSQTGVTDLVGDFEVSVNRFIIAYGGANGKLKLTDAGFTAATLLGLSTASDVDLLSKTSDSDFAIIEATFTDQGDYMQVDVDDTDFFGTEGGVEGRLDVFFGSMTQAESDYLTTQFGTTAPAFRGICYAVQRHMYVGNTAYPKPLSFTIRRCPNQLGLPDEHHNIGGDANVACMLWELLTDTIWGLGMPEAQLERDSFVAAGETLYAEGFGLSMILDTTSPAADVAQELLRHVDGVLYIDHLSGLIAMRLARADYVVADLPLVSPANADSCQIKQRSWDETRNVIRLRYVDRAQGYTERVLQLQDQANIDSRGGDMAIEDIPMPGISSEAVASIAAARALRVLSALPRQVTLVVNRERWSLRPGAPFRMTWPDWGITDMPCRVSRIGLGNLTDGKIRVDATQDVIGPAWTGFSPPAAPPDDPDEPIDLPEFNELLGDQALFGETPMPTG